MRNIRMVITVALILCLCGCSETTRVPEMPDEPPAHETLPIMSSEEISQETDAPKSSADICTAEESSVASEPDTPVVQVTECVSQPEGDIKTEPPKEESSGIGDSMATSSFEPVNTSYTPTETSTVEAVPEAEPPQVPEQPAETEASNEPEQLASPVVTEPEPAFDINYWISYAQGVAVSKGLALESSAVDCWDNPITANPDCIYLERDINSRMNRYAKDEDVTDVWIWYECVGVNSYLIYVGYA